MEEYLPRPLQHRCALPELVGLHEKIQEPFDAGGLCFNGLFQPRPGGSGALGGCAVHLFHALVGERLKEILLLQLIRLTRLLDFPELPFSVLPLERPKFLELRRRLIPAQESLGPVIHVIVPRGGRDQGCKFALIFGMRVADIYNLDALDSQWINEIDLVIALEPGQLLAMCAV